MSTKGHNLTAEAREHITQLRPVLDAENTSTKSVPVAFDDVLMSGTPSGPEPQPVSHGQANGRRVTILAWVASVLGASVLVFGVVVVALIEAGAL